MLINVQVVSALLHLRGISLQTLAQFSGIHPQRLALWLRSQQNDEVVPFDRQLEILALLGIRNETPREDLVHHWNVTEPLFGMAARTYAPLRAVLDAFGPAEVAYLVCETDPAFTLRVVNRYALKFRSGFYSILTVRSSPLRNVMFDPAAFTNLSWMTGNVAVLLDRRQYERLEPGIVAPKELASHVDFALEEMKWHSLRHLAAERQVSPGDLAQWILHARSAATTPTAAASVLPPTSEASPTLDLGLQRQAQGPAAHARMPGAAPAATAPTGYAAHVAPPAANEVYAAAQSHDPVNVVNIPSFLLKARRTADTALHGH